MKKFYFVLCMFLSVNMFAQNAVADFEEAAITPDSANSQYLMDETGTFTSGDFLFGQYVDTSWGDAYYYGFVVSNHTDTDWQSFDDAYQVVGGQAHSGDNFAVWYASWYGGDRVSVAGDKAKKLDCFYINNTTYVEHAITVSDGMTQGSFTADDWFKLTIYGWNGATMTDSIDFYLAKDGSYIQEWTKVDLTALGAVTELSFAMSSTRNNSYGMTTPAYFCMDDLTYAIEQGLEDAIVTEKAQKVIINGVLYINRDGRLYNALGAEVR